MRAPKPAGLVVLSHVTKHGLDPILAQWQYGLGRVVAWTSDAQGRWSANLVSRGQGNRLADDIVRGALAIIERTGSDEAVTLRAVAREVGIAAPSIYAHFADREAIIMAAVVSNVAADVVDRFLASKGKNSKGGYS